MFGIFRKFLVFGAAGFLGIPAWADLPLTYDLRDYGWITPTKNQGSLGVCWAFAATTTYQSSLLRNGAVTEALSTALDTSVWHLATHNGNQTDLTFPYDGWGGDNYYAVGYWTRGEGEWKSTSDTLVSGGGAVMVSTDPLNVYPFGAVAAHEDLAPYVPPARQPLAPYRLVQSYDFAYKGPGTTTVAYRDQLKQLMLDHGALSIGMTAGGGSAEPFSNFYNPVDATFRYTGTGAMNHEVVIAGWDDNKVVNINGVVSTGAWLVQNSWGTDFGQGGYFWIAYDDTRAATDGSAFDVREAAYKSTVLQNQIFAGTDPAGAGEGNESRAASKMESPNDETLMALGLYMAGPQDFSISIYDDWGAAGPEGEALTTMDHLSVTNMGYVELTLNAPLFLQGGDAIYVVVNYGSDVAYPIMLDSKSLTLEGFDSFLGLSWEWENGQWNDLAANGDGILFMKGLLAVPEPSAIVLIGLGFVLLIALRRRVVRG